MSTIPASSLPASEAEIIARLKIKPESIKMTMVTKDGQKYDRHWVALKYEFKDKLTKLGSFLYKITCDVEQAGGCVLSISLPPGINLHPNNDDPDNYSPHKKWLGSVIDVNIRTQLAVNQNKAMWDAAAKDLLGRTGQNHA